MLRMFLLLISLMTIGLVNAHEPPYNAKEVCVPMDRLQYLNHPHWYFDEVCAKISLESLYDPYMIIKDDSPERMHGKFTLAVGKNKKAEVKKLCTLFGLPEVYNKDPLRLRKIKGPFSFAVTINGNEPRRLFRAEYGKAYDVISCFNSY